jgi:hypothetical protein
MGNIVSDNGTLKDTSLKNLIDDWAKNDYDDGMTYDLGMNEYDNKIRTKLKNLLEKRARCTKQNKMNISLPEFTITTNGSAIMNNTDFLYYPVNIEIVENLSDNKIMNDGDYNFNQAKISAEFDFMPNPKCKLLYEGDINATTKNKEFGFCKHVEDEKVLMYNKGDITLNIKQKIAYDDKAYMDCNCMNTTFKHINDIDKQIKFYEKDTVTAKQLDYGTDVGVSPYILAQNLDMKCTALGKSGQAYLPFYENLEGCMQIDNINIFNNTASDINLVQNKTCNQTKISGAPETKQANVNDAIKKQLDELNKLDEPLVSTKTLIIILSVIGSIIVAILVYLYISSRTKRIKNISSDMIPEPAFMG